MEKSKISQNFMIFDENVTFLDVRFVGDILRDFVKNALFRVFQWILDISVKTH